jgi:ubiquinone/menaquinone biosynthesis C-methylase UbiE
VANINDRERVAALYVEKDTLSTRIDLHQKYSVNPYGWFNWVFDQYALEENMRVLELGCGSGAVWQGREEKLPPGLRVLLTDFSPLMVEKAKAALTGSSFSFGQVDAGNIPFPDGSFDAVIANHMLYHVPDMAGALAEISRVLVAGGHFYATTVGAGSRRELTAIYRQMEGEATFTYLVDNPFTLDNGRELLTPYFSAVERRDYEDALRVTNPDDLVAYILSYNSVPDESKDRLTKLVESGFSAEGVFSISKEQGMFVCVK